MGDIVIERRNLISSEPFRLTNLLWKFINLIRSNRWLYLSAKVLRSIKRNGIKETAGKITAGMRKRSSSLETLSQLSKAERTSQESARFPKKIKISVIVPLYNTQELFLEEMIESVVAQTYGNWELLLADGSDKDHENVMGICYDYARKDPRIRYKRLDANRGVSANSNKAIEMASGEYIGILEHDDILHPSALYEMVGVICGEGADFVYTDEAFFSQNYNITLKHHKPDYAIDTLCSHNYISRFTVFSRELMNRAGVFRAEYDGSQDYDLILRYTAAASKICHISKLLYFHRSRESSDVKKKMYVISAAERAIGDHLKNRGISAKVETKIGLPGYYRVIYELTERPLVSIIIPNKDNAPLLRNCLSSIMEKTTYDNYEIIIVENNSVDGATFSLYKELERYPNIRVVYWDGKGFNYSEICNFGVQCAKGQQLVFFNNDVLIISPNWIEEMLMFSQRRDVGAVGMKLYFLNGSIQHAGVILGLGVIAGHIFYGAPHNAIGYMGKLQIVQNMSAVTAACMMVRREVFEETGRFAPEFCVSYNDIDLCIKIRKAGYLIIWTPYAEAYHLESKSRGYNTTTEKQHKLAREVALFKDRWAEELAVAGDPYYNTNFSLESVDYSPK